MYMHVAKTTKSAKPEKQQYPHISKVWNAAHPYSSTLQYSVANYSIA